MQNHLFSIALLVLLACSGSTTPDATDEADTDTDTDADSDADTDADTDTSGACGDVSTWSVTLTGGVLDATGAPAVGAHVWVEDRGWVPGTVLGEGTTDADGNMSLFLGSVTSVEDCWGLILNYVLCGETTGQYGERDINPVLFNAIDGGTLEADLGTQPLELESTE